MHSCAHRFKGRGIEYDDLFGAGSIGLIKAIDAFDENRGVKFSTYAVPVILGEMRRLFRDGGAIKVSRSLKELSLKVVRQREKFMVDHFRFSRFKSWLLCWRWIRTDCRGTGSQPAADVFN